jgi:outer membrane protein assembly factor BamB
MSRLASLVTIVALVMLSAPPAHALPSQQPDETWMVNGPVRALERVKGTIWIGGSFTRLRSSADGGTTIRVRGLAALDAETGAPVPGLHLPKVGGGDRVVYDLDVGGGVLYAGGKFDSVDGKPRSNLVAIDPKDGRIMRFSSNAPTTYAVLADPGGGVYAGKPYVRRYRPSGAHDKRFEIQTPTVSAGSANGPVILDLAFAPDGDVFVAGAFDFLNGESHRIIAKLDPASGEPGPWALGGPLGTNPRGIDLFVDAGSDALFAAVGGSDFAARYRISDGELLWKIDTSGASQAIARWDAGQIVVGGHFKWVAAERGIQCGSNKHPTGDCEPRLRLAALDAETGDLDPAWDPAVRPLYFGVWSVLVRARRLHVGGEFTEIEGVPQLYYARLS